MNSESNAIRDGMRRPLLLAALALGALAWAMRRGDVPAPDVVEDAMNAVGGWQLPARAEKYREIIDATEQAFGIPHDMLARLLYEESRFRDDIITGQVRSSTGAVGIAQFMPATSSDLGVDPLKPRDAIVAAGRYLRQLFDALGDWRSALAAYNWGVGNVRRKGLAAAPRETRDYVARITEDIGYA